MHCALEDTRGNFIKLLQISLTLGLNMAKQCSRPSLSCAKKKSTEGCRDHKHQTPNCFLKMMSQSNLTQQPGYTPPAVMTHLSATRPNT